jgi:hydroxymethylpyrimidine pyrophosphatase-like HAD family hydrolase
MKTIICDIDGTLIKYLGNTHGMIYGEVTPLPGVVIHLNRWEQQGHKIILMTGRFIHVSHTL